MDSNLDLLFPVHYDRDREIQRLFTFMAEWTDTQRLYSLAFGSTDLSAPTGTVNPADLHASGAQVSDNEYESFMGESSAENVS